MTVERYGSKTDIVVKLVLVFFIALLSFSIGTFVGKKFSDNQHKLAQLESTGAEEHAASESHDERSVASVPPDATEVKPGQALSDEEIAKLAEEFVADDTPSEPSKINDKSTDHGNAKTAQHEAEDEEAPATHEAPEKHKEPLKVAENLAHGQSAVEHEAKPSKAVEAKKRIPSSLPKDIAASAFGKYTVQVGSYPTEKEAQTIASDLKAKGFSAFYIPAKVKGDTWYRVGVGMFTTAKEAQSYRSDLLAKTKVTSAFVQKVSAE